MRRYIDQEPELPIYELLSWDPCRVHILLAALLAMLIVLAGFACVWHETLNRVTAELPIVGDKAIAREALLTRQLADRHLTALHSQITGLRGDVKEMERDLAGRSEQQIAAFRADVVQQLAALNTTIDRQASKVTDPIPGLFPPLRNTLDRVSVTSDLLLDCDHNANCLANRTIGTMKAVEKTSASVERRAGRRPGRDAFHGGRGAVHLARPGRDRQPFRQARDDGQARRRHRLVVGRQVPLQIHLPKEIDHECHPQVLCSHRIVVLPPANPEGQKEKDRV